ncbi:MAG TPA: hypothetical protein VFB82_02250, partial [Blastocatellia bacterium]|nr:hypothetical protein [Blastocatellia bacterium]
MTRAPDIHDKPRLGITLGDPAGIGPEIVLKAIASHDVLSASTPIIVGPASELRRQARLLDLRCD